MEESNNKIQEYLQLLAKSNNSDSEFIEKAYEEGVDLEECFEQKDNPRGQDYDPEIARTILIVNKLTTR